MRSRCLCNGGTKKAVAAATALREREAGDFAKAINAISTGMGGAFLQTNNANSLREMSVNMDMSSVDRDVLSSFFDRIVGVCPGKWSSCGNPQANAGHYDN